MGRQESKSFPLAFGNMAALWMCTFTGEVGSTGKLRWTEAQAKGERVQHLWPWWLFPYVVVNIREDRQKLRVTVGFRAECVCS